MKKLIQEHKILWQNKNFVGSVIFGVLFLCISVVLNYQAGTYAFATMSSGVSDLILDNLPRMNVELVFIQGAILMAIVTFLLGLYYPKYMPALLKNIALLYLFRSVAISLTHLGPPADMEGLYLADSITQRFIYGADYFFSGHTALPFIVALIFWEKKPLRYLYLGITILFGFTALLGHVHYSIDVFAAPFIAHSTYFVTGKLFPKDYDLISTSKKVN